MKKILIFLFFPLMLSCWKNEKKETVGTIHITPDSTITIYASDLFDSYRIVYIEDELCMIINDFAFFNDKIVVNNIQFGSMPTVGGLASKLKVFDYTGNFLYQIGDIGRGHGEYLSAGKVVTIEEDSTITVNNNTQILNYNINNTLNYSRLLYSNFMGNRLNISIGEDCGAINDSCLLMASPIGEYRKYKFITTSKDGERVYHGLFDQDPMENRYGSPLLYRYDEKINYYNSDDHTIYEISQDTAIVRYEIISNNPNEEFNIGSIIETKQYIFLGGGVLYNKKSGQSFKYQLIDDMILPEGLNKNQRGMRYDNRGLNKNFHSHILFQSNIGHNITLKNCIDSLKNHMSTNEWKSYVAAKPDVVEVLNRISKKSKGEAYLPILFGYKFKDNI